MLCVNALHAIISIWSTIPRNLKGIRATTPRWTLSLTVVQRQTLTIILFCMSLTKKKAPRFTFRRENSIFAGRIYLAGLIRRLIMKWNTSLFYIAIWMVLLYFAPTCHTSQKKYSHGSRTCFTFYKNQTAGDTPVNQHFVVSDIMMHALV